MFTSVPYLSDIYENIIYKKAYEKNRYFETLYSRELFLNYRVFKDAKFYLQRCTNKKIEDTEQYGKLVRLLGKNIWYKKQKIGYMIWQHKLKISAMIKANRCA